MVKFRERLVLQASCENYAGNGTKMIKIMCQMKLDWLKTNTCLTFWTVLENIKLFLISLDWQNFSFIHSLKSFDPFFDTFVLPHQPLHVIELSQWDFIHQLSSLPSTRGECTSHSIDFFSQLNSSIDWNRKFFLLLLIFDSEGQRKKITSYDWKNRIVCRNFLRLRNQKMEIKTVTIKRRKRRSDADNFGDCSSAN